MPDYQLGKIYTIICNITKEQYIGSTCEPTLARRLAGHNGAYRDWLNDPKKYRYTSSFQILARGNYQIVLLENCPCNNVDEVKMRERFYFDTIPNINMVKPFRSVEEEKDYKNEWYEKHKEITIERSNQYREDHKEEISAYSKEYREEHKEEIKEQKHQYYEENKIAIKEKVKKWREDHKAELCKRRKEKITCECGTVYTVSNKLRHIKSIKHQKFINL